MELVIDSNILFAALIKNSATSEILFKHTLYAPEFIFEEFNKYKEYLKDKTKREEDEFEKFLDLFERNVILVPKEEYSKFITEAEKISTDEKDVLYFALALKLKCGIWSNDKKLKTQNKVKVYSTEELLKEI